MNYRKYKRRSKHLISIPFIWLALFPAIVLDSVVELYHRVCFPLWGLPTVKRSDYIKMDLCNDNIDSKNLIKICVDTGLYEESKSSLLNNQNMEKFMLKFAMIFN